MLLLGLLILIISCKANEDNNNTANSSDNMNDTTNETSNSESDLPKRNFDGMEITFLTRPINHGASERHYSEAYAEEQNAELMNDAIYKRNLAIEEKYNVKIRSIASSSSNVATIADDIRISYDAGEVLFDAAFASVNDSATLYSNGYLVDLKTVPNLNLDKSWWDQRAIEGLSIGGKLFSAVGDITPWSYPMTGTVIVNNELIKQYMLENPYELVKNNNWTFDKFYELSLAVSEDLNGNGAMDENDRYGGLLAREKFFIMFIAGGNNFVKKDADDLPYVTIYNERSLQVAQKIFDILTDRNATYIMEYYSLDPFGGQKYANPFEEMIRTPFRNGQGLFIQDWLGAVIGFRDLETDIGILPLPKYDSNQDEYYCMVSTFWASNIVIPKSNEKLDETGFIIEALCAESTNTLRPAFYEYTLTAKMLRDEESIDMLDIIFNSRVYDIGIINNWGNMVNMFAEIFDSGTFNFASKFDERQATVESDMQRTIDSFINYN